MKKNKKQKILDYIFWTVAILTWVAVSIIAAQLIIGNLMVLILGKENFSNPVSTAVFSALSYIIAMILIIFVPPVLKNCWKNDKKDKKIPKNLVSCGEIGLKGWPTWTDIGLAPVGYLAYLILGMVATSIFSIFPWFDAGQAQDVGFNTYIVGIDRIVAFLTLVVVAPIAEEIIFRGWLYGKLREKFSTATTNTASIIISALLVSILFGFIHLQWNVGVNVFALSLVLCALREITGTIYAGILLHMLKNGIAFYLLYIIGIR